ncbi:Alpha/Beta hydrolase protein [Desarmillaria tabescens]|uniref:Alpha/Beta hydrolase protein n=1 Tax=Armillaria tabescens TaxID=1929756 RepID=A0AA39NF44_ARMTA|nr:Alpha/Beta hydrolase protein [Desarmillaria tabescens]KAK0464497.1 Alpha/Beta hydrolase protein [Desarmillaria tabescens]
MIEPHEKLLTLSDGRTLAYADNGDPASSVVVVFFHGTCGIGRASRMSSALRDLGVHYVTPTLPGWGNSTPRRKNQPYVATLLSDFTELINQLHPHSDNLRIYVAGGSFGSVPAQILYGSPFDTFPLGRKIVGCLLLVPFSPFRWHKGYAKNMKWPIYVSMGAPSQTVPMRFVPRLAATLTKWQLKTVDKAEAFIRKNLFDRASAQEREAFLKWKETEGVPEGQLERETAEDAVSSMAKTSEGFMEMSDVLSSDWGFRPDSLSEEHTRRPLFIVASSEDDLGPDMAKWLAENYRNSRLKWVPGGHISTTYHSRDIWTEFIEVVEGAKDAASHP